MPDNWKHRSENMNCKTCMWFMPKIVTEVGSQSGVVRQIPCDLGRCRRHAPTLGGWPAVFVNDWCGDHKLDENKIGLDEGWRIEVPQNLFGDPAESSDRPKVPRHE